MELIIEKNVQANQGRSRGNRQRKVAAFRISYRDATHKRHETYGPACEQYSERAGPAIDRDRRIVLTTYLSVSSPRKSLPSRPGKQRLDIMMQNVATLPESEQGLVAQLQGLRQRDDTITKEKQTLFNEKGRLSDSIAANNRQMRLIEDFDEKETQDTARHVSQVEDTPAYGELIKRRADLNAQLDTLLKVYKEKHPAVIAKQSEIARVNEEFENLKKSTDKRVQTATAATGRKAELQKKSLDLENQRIQSDRQLEQQIAARSRGGRTRDRSRRSRRGSTRSPNEKLLSRHQRATLGLKRRTTRSLRKRMMPRRSSVSRRTPRARRFASRTRPNVPQSPVAAETISPDHDGNGDRPVHRSGNGGIL